MRLFPYLVLTRPANVVTAISDIIAGIAISGTFLGGIEVDIPTKIILLVLSTIGLYAGGIVFNDVFDADLDAKERPERPIPSGQVSKNSAAIFGLSLLIFGIVCAFLVSNTSGIAAVAISFFAVLYDKYGKHNQVLGPINMGICRGLNLFLGMSIVQPDQLASLWMICLLPIVFVSAITLTSQGEVFGNNRLSIIFAMLLDIVVAGAILFMANIGKIELLSALPFLILWIGMNLIAKTKAIVDNVPGKIMKAVKIGVLSLIPLNACYVAGFSTWMLGLAVLLLLPISILLAKKFAVT
ncbi:MAG: UbiA-like protein EboC [Cyclobacteriaceae bacterium]